MIKSVKLLQKIGNANIGDIFVRALFKKPKSETFKELNDDYFFWREGSKYEEHEFLPHHIFSIENDGILYTIIQNI